MEFELKAVDMDIICCPYCLGTGKLKAMQSAMTYDAGSVRVADTKVKCKHCNGLGIKIKSR